MIYVLVYFVVTTVACFLPPAYVALRQKPLRLWLAVGAVLAMFLLWLFFVAYLDFSVAEPLAVSAFGSPTNEVSTIFERMLDLFRFKIAPFLMCLTPFVSLRFVYKKFTFGYFCIALVTAALIYVAVTATLFGGIMFALGGGPGPL